jgi:hypothetical protein
VTEEIIQAVCAAIYGEFGEGYTLYTEAVAQDAAVPCFFVICTQSRLNRVMGDLYHKETPLVIQYLPKDTENYRSECEDASERLFLTLDQIPFKDGYINGTELRAEIIDGVLNFFVNYDMNVIKQTPQAPRMEKINVTQELK